MKNGERTIKKITKHGAKNILIHSIYGTTNWIISEKTEPNLWKISLFNPTKNTTYNIGTTNNKQHKKTWSTLITHETEEPTNQIKIAQELKTLIKNFKTTKPQGHFIEKIPKTKTYIIGKQNPDKTWTLWIKQEKKEEKQILQKEKITTKEIIIIHQLIIQKSFNPNYNQIIKNIKNKIHNHQKKH